MLTTIDPATGEKDPQREPLRTLEGYRRRDARVYFGQNLVPRALGVIRTGADCAIDEIIAP